MRATATEENVAETAATKEVDDPIFAEIKASAPLAKLLGLPSVDRSFAFQLGEEKRFEIVEAGRRGDGRFAGKIEIEIGRSVER